MKSLASFQIIDDATAAVSHAHLRPDLLDDAISQIIQSDIFDLKFYCAQINQDCSLAEAIADYIVHGEDAGFLPHLLFRPSFVKRQLTALGIAMRKSVLNAYVEIVDQALDPHPLFDATYYWTTHGRGSKEETALQNYERRRRAGELFLSPNGLFDPRFYYANYGDVAHFGMDAFQHYVRIGRLRGFQPHPLFRPSYFRQSLVDQGVALPPDDILENYLRSPALWEAAPHPLFDPAFYSDQLAKRDLNGDLKHPPVVDLLLREADVSSHRLFDVAFYRRQAEIEGIDIGTHALSHYVGSNGRVGLDPHPLFDTLFYLEKYPSAAMSAYSPLEHFLAEAAGQGFDPNPLFSQVHYRGQGPSSGAGTDALKHYQEHGGKAFRDPHPLFDSALYAALNPDCMVADGDPLSNYVSTSLQMGFRFPPWGTLMRPRRGQARDADPVDIVLVSHELSLTGAPRILLKIAEHLVASRGLKVVVISANGGLLLEAFCEWASVFDLSQVPGDEGTRCAVLALIGNSMRGKRKPKLIVVNTACVPHIGAALAASGVPVITLVHEMASGFPYEIFKSIYETSRFVVYPADFVKGEAHRLYPLPANKSFVMPQGLLEPDFGAANQAAARKALCQEIGVRPDAFIVLGCGTLDLRKGIDVFVKLASAANARTNGTDQHRLIFFVWIGDGVKEPHSPFWYALQDLIRSGAEEYMFFLGSKPSPETYFQGCDVFVLTSRLDPFPCVVQEAMACAKPVIVFEKSGGAPEALQDGAGIVVPYGDAAEMAAAIRALADDPRRARDLGLRAKEIVHEKYSFARYVERLIDKANERIGLSLGVEASSSLAPRSRGRVVVTLVSWDVGPFFTFLSRLLQGLMDRGFASEIIFTGDRLLTPAVGFLPDVPYSFLAAGRQMNLGFVERCDRLAQILRAAAPAVLIHHLDVVGSAVAPMPIKGLGILGVLSSDHPEFYEQASRLGRYWQRTVSTDQRIKRRLDEEMPELKGTFIPYGVLASEPPPSRGAVDPLRIVCPCPAEAQRDLFHLLKIVAEALERCVRSFSITLLGRDADEAMLATIFEREMACGTIQVMECASSSDTVQILEKSDVLLSFDPSPLDVQPIEAMRLGVVVIALRGADDREMMDGALDGHGAFILPRIGLGRCRDILIDLAQNPTLRQKLRCAAYKTGLERSALIDDVCDRYAQLLDEMFAEIRDQEYVKPGPAYEHPTFGALSLPPTFQFDPIRIGTAMSISQSADSRRSDEGLALQEGWVPIFELSRDGPQPLSVGNAKLCWLDKELEIIAADETAGMTIDARRNYSRRLMLQVSLRVDESAKATISSQTVNETVSPDPSVAQFLLDEGANKINLMIVRETSVSSVRLSPLGRPGKVFVRDLTLFAPANQGQLDHWAPILPMSSTVDFRLNGNANQYLAGEWYDPEPFLRWTRADRGEIRFVPEIADQRGARLWILCRSLFDVRVKQNIEADDEIWAFDADDWTLRALYLPTRPVEAKWVVRIKFHLDHVVSRSALGISADSRLLGLGVKTMGLFPESMPRSEVVSAFQFPPG